MSGMDLADFLLARISEDEAVACAVQERIAELDRMWDDDTADARWTFVEWSRPGASSAQRGPIPDHIARWDPVRVLAECEAKRRIVELWTEATEDLDEDDVAFTMSMSEYPSGVLTTLWSTLRLLALPYADHPDYDASVTDDIVTHDEVLRWQPDNIRREWADAERSRILAMPPEERGWWTREEMERDGGRFVEVTELSERDPRFYRTGG